MKKITFKKADFQILGRNEYGSKYGIITRKEVDGYTFLVPEKGYYYFCLRQVNGMWEVTHAITGLSIGAREKTREKAAEKALEMLPRVLESLKSETMKKALEAYENAPLEDVVKLWETMEYTTLKDRRLTKLENAAKQLKLHIRENTADYQHGGKISISGLPKDLEAIKALIDEFEREDAALRTPEEPKPAEDKIVGHSITPAGTVVLFYASGKREKFEKGAAGYDAALEATEQAAEEPTTETAAEPEPKTEEQAAEQTEQAEQEKRVIPEKTFTDTKIVGNGWRIIFNGKMQRTMIYFDLDPKNAALRLLEKERFFHSSIYGSWNKKLTWKAYRAAQRVAAELEKIYA